MNILIAGGSGLLGRHLKKSLEKNGHRVKVLSRRKETEHYIYWNPVERQIDKQAIEDTEVLINLSGKGILDHRWSKKHGRELHNSRIGTNEFLHSVRSSMPQLRQIVSASGINCYGYKQREEPYTESDLFGDDVVSQLVKEWEASADLFGDKIPVTKLRTSVVLSDKGGALNELLNQIRRGFGAVVGSGKQPVVWIHIDDFCGIVQHSIEYQLDGSYNCVAGSVSNEIMTNTLAERVGKKIRLPKIPEFVIRIILGKLAILVLKGVEVSNKKITSSGYQFRFNSFKEALRDLNLDD